ncbi:MAG: response regulator [Microcoleus sp. PH2017_39_LGB_O_B]|uniref:response regulator n=1 Tax=unclassified Microcoleus TaxID=2642155 RepID=UPI001D9DAE9A|nr:MULTISPECIES: response regulator [unclassified Microcoleus]TAF89298.1 MAG: response regulator [Oscillatoriales cyanobacterium]MCC3448802.1 response regulator [Microcoleus sp. PH2017_09_SFU_O_A]MCC3629790.1 response regulator [Microcoleus sp. PH2017_39_LGB_O_B]MCC3642900.1 response regulator [Microcoleus sp. PH2017_33_LGB_O_A]TAG74242.1 MAG: response regulator [Oscillatoriales cyanobacterium]
MKKPVIVCIDDEPDVLNSLKIELKKAIGDRCIIETAEGGEDALELLEDLQADEYEIALVLSDYIMPDIKGDELLKKIHERSPDTLTIMLTGQADLEALSNAIKYAKLYRYIPKPWHNEDLKLTVVEAIHSYLQDQKLTDEILKRQEVNAALSASESRLNQFLAALPVGVSVYNPDGSIAYFNQAARDLLGADTIPESTAEQLAATYQLYVANTDELYPPDNLPILRALKGEFVKVDDVEIRQDGKIIAIEINTTPIFDARGNIVYAIAAFQDITDRKRAERILADYQHTLETKIDERTEQLQQAALAAEAANKAKSTFLANMSHELRTPLNSILGFAQIMEGSSNFTVENHENLSIIRRSGEHLLALINEVLDLSKIEAGRMILDPKDFDLYRLLDDLQDMFQMRAKNQEVQLLFQRENDVAQYVRTDDVKLRQVLINILSNAIKFTEQGSIVLRVSQLEKSRIVDLLNSPTACIDTTKSIREFATDRSDVATVVPRDEPDDLTDDRVIFLQFEIEDTGVGIASEELGNIFKAFVQTSSGQRTQKGTGLGLTITRQFVRLMGGEIVVESELERGTSFKFEIPVGVVDVANIPAPEINREVTGLEPNQPWYRILIVDDREDNRQLLVKILSPLGFGVREASDGCEAIEMWENWQPHLILMDLRMPVMDGYEATKEIRNRIQQQERQEKGSVIPKIVALTASTIEEKRSSALSIGCDDFISKPFRKTDIFDTLHKHLGVRYLYSYSTDFILTGDRHNQSDAPSNAALAYLPALPAEWIENMRQVIRSADFDLIARTIEELRYDHPEFTEILQDHLNNFDYQKILTLIAEA